MPYRFALPLLLLAATPAFAQTAAATDAPVAAAPDSAATPGHGRGGYMSERLQKIHDRLAITPAQEPKWDAVVATLRENAQAMRANPASTALRGGKLTAVQDLRAAADLARVRADALQRMIPPVDALYATLSPDQQRAADETLSRAMRGGPKHEGHRHG
ncbi:MAG: Spy/CpxP family protein refolding chaperone [Janthinobacterium lividum]